MFDQRPHQQRKSVKLFSVFILLLLGAALALAAELPYGGWIQIPLLSILWWRLDFCASASFKKQFVLGLIFGISYFVVGLWWLYISLHDVGGMNVLLASMGVFYSPLMSQSTFRLPP